MNGLICSYDEYRVQHGRYENDTPAGSLLSGTSFRCLLLSFRQFNSPLELGVMPSPVRQR